MKKRIAALLMAVTVAISSMGIAFAAENGSVTLNGPDEAKAGNEIEVTVDLSTNPGLTALGLRVAYDSEYLTLKNVVDGGIFEKLEKSQTYDVNPYVLNFSSATAESAVTATGTLATMTFEVAEDAPGGETEIICTIKEAYDFDLNDVSMDGDKITVAVDGVHQHSLTKVEAKEATCTIAGNNEYCTCSCGKVFKDAEGTTETTVEAETIAAKGHTWDDGVVTKEPTEDTEGEKTFTCIVEGCGATKIEPIPALDHAHKLTPVEAKEATCTQKGNNAYYACSCGKVFKDAEGATETTVEAETIPAKGHTWDEGKVTTEPTCTEKGVKTYTCSVCGDTKTEEIATVAHQYNANGVCTVCGEKKPSGGGGGGSATVTPTEPEITTGGGTTVAEIEAKVTTSGTTSKTAVTQDTLDKAIEAAENAAGKAGTDAAVEIVVNTSAKATEVKVDLPAEGLESFADSEAQSLTISSGVGSVTISPEAAASMADQAQSDTVTVTISEVTQPEKALNERQLAAVGDAPVYELCVTSNGKYISQFDGGLITVSLPYTLKAGEDPNGVVVYYVDDLGNLQRVRAMYDVKTQSIIFTTNHFSFYMVRYESNAAAAARFTDVPFDAYYQSAVGWAVSHGVTGGVTETTFAPSNPCTRAQAVTFLWRAAGSPAPKSAVNPFTDVKAGAYYYDAVLWAVENGITKGTTDTTFSPNATCSRAQIVTFLWRSQKSPAAGTVNPFTDVAAGAYYQNAVLWAVKNGITGGTTATTFSPNNNCTRAQIVTFLYRNVNG